MSIKGDEGDIIYRERSVHHPKTPTLGATTRLRYVTPTLSQPLITNALLLFSLSSSWHLLLANLSILEPALNPARLAVIN